MSAQRATQLLDAGVWLQMSGDTEGARRLFEQAAKLDPANARAQQLLDSIAANSDEQAAEIARAAATVGGVPSNPFKPPPVEPPAMPGLMEMDWAGAMGVDPTAPGEASGSSGAARVPPSPEAQGPAARSALRGPPGGAAEGSDPGSSQTPRRPPSPMDFFFDPPEQGARAASPPKVAPVDEAPMWRALSEPMPPLPTYPDSGDPSVPEAWEVAFTLGPDPGHAAPDPFDAESVFGAPGSFDATRNAPGGELVPKVRAVTFASAATSAWDSQSNPGVQVQDVKPGLGVAMDLVEPAFEPPSAETADVASEGGERDRERQREVEALLQGARDLLDLDDHTGAMELITKAQQLSPTNAAVLALRERSEKTLQAMFESRLGHMTAKPKVVLKDDEIIWLNLDHRAGFVLAQIDGTVSFEDLFEVCGMSRLDTARILAQLMDEGVISAG